MTSTAAALAAALACATGPAAQAGPEAPRTERVSTTSDGAQGDGPSADPAISADGRYAGFTSTAAGFGCAAFFDCLRVKDLATGEVVPVGAGDGAVYSAPLFSADGSRIAYTATKRFAMPYLHDRATGTSERLWPADPPDRNELGAVHDITPDGTHVAYGIGTRSGNQGSRLLYVRDTGTGTDEIVSAPDEGGKAAASLSADGRRVAYGTGGPDATVHVKDRDTGERTRIGAGLGRAELVRITGNGRRVLFNAQDGLYAHDLRTGATRRVAETPAASATGDGRRVLLAEDDALRVLDLRTGRRTDVGPAGVRADQAALDARGRTVVFGSDAADLVPDDTNGVSDVFVRHTR
ncbi:hypothetical protein AB0I16_27115 [Streptomyces sp. NPDC050703]|uniref:hypothetical protein n=1 Tax=Streptomyces sp. NPDC050703 TaxID=3157218 RepID=UPI00341542EA